MKVCDIKEVVCVAVGLRSSHRPDLDERVGRDAGDVIGHESEMRWSFYKPFLWGGAMCHDRSRMARPLRPIAPHPAALTRVGPSSIHGDGLFAAEDILPNRLIGEYQGPLVNSRHRKRYDGRYLMYSCFKGKLIDGVSLLNKMRYVNHAPEDRCNASLKKNLTQGICCIYAKKLIRKGDEITFDYGYDPAERYNAEVDVTDLDALIKEALSGDEETSDEVILINGDYEMM
jgi:hypothetical protein